MRIFNIPERVTDADRIGKLKAYMATRTDVDFNEVRAALPDFKDLEDGEIHQVAIDAEFEVVF